MSPVPLSAYQGLTETPKPTTRAKSPAESVQSRRSAISVNEPNAQHRREPNARVSFYDPVNQATLDRLLSGDVMLPLAQEPKDEDADEEGGGVEIENALATLASVEEMLEGYEWASENILSGKVLRGTADQIQARLLDELMALEKVCVSLLPLRCVL